MATFTLDSSRLGGTAQGTASTDQIAGQFREVEIHLSQGTAGVDLLVRFLEVHLTSDGVSEEVIA